MGLFGGIQRLVTGEPVLRRPTTVIEIGSDRLKIAENSVGLVGRSITKLTCLPLPATEEGLATAVRAGVKASHASRQSVIACLPRNLVTVRVLTIPATDPDEVSRMVHLQAGRQTPYSKEEVVSAYRVLGTDEKGYSTVLLAIARRSIIAQRLRALESVGASPVRIGISSEGLWAWLALSEGQDAFSGAHACAVLDVDTAYSDLAVFSGGHLAFTRSILIGSTNLGAADEDGILDLVKEVQDSLQRYRTENAGAQPDRLVLVGAAAVVARSRSPLADALGIPVSVGEPMHNVRARRRDTVLSQPEFRDVSVAPLIGTAVTPEAAGGINLIPPEILAERGMDEKRRQLNLMGLLGLVIVTLVSVLLFLNLYGKHRELARITSAVASVKPDAEAVENMRRQVELLAQRLDARGVPMNLLAEVYRVTPDPIAMTSVSIDAKSKIVLRGRGAAMSDVFSYVTVLEASPLLQGAKTTYTSVKRVGDVEFAEFEISCLYEAPQ